MKCYLWNSAKNALVKGDKSLLSDWRENPGSTLWLHLSGDMSDEAESFLEEQFKLHPLGLEDAKRDRHPPKFELLSNSNSEDQHEVLARRPMAVDRKFVYIWFVCM